MSSAPELCVGAVAVVDDELLMVRRANAPGLGLWSIPGGRVERGEVMAEAVVREVREETGVDVFCAAPIDWVERISESHHFVIVNFAVVLAGESTLYPGSDALEAAWVPLDEVAEQTLVPGLAKFLSDHQIIDTLV